MTVSSYLKLSAAHLDPSVDGPACLLQQCPLKMLFLIQSQCCTLTEFSWEGCENQPSPPTPELWCFIYMRRRADAPRLTINQHAGLMEALGGTHKWHCSEEPDGQKY